MAHYNPLKGWSRADGSSLFNAGEAEALFKDEDQQQDQAIALPLPAGPSTASSFTVTTNPASHSGTSSAILNHLLSLLVIF